MYCNGQTLKTHSPTRLPDMLKNLHATMLGRIHGPVGVVCPVAWGKCVPTPGSWKDSSSGPSWFFSLLTSLQFFYPLLWLQRKKSSFANLGVILWPWFHPFLLLLELNLQVASASWIPSQTHKLKWRLCLSPLFPSTSAPLGYLSGLSCSCQIPTCPSYSAWPHAGYNDRHR